MSNEIIKLFKSADITVPEDVLQKYLSLYKHISGEESSMALGEIGSTWRPQQIKLVHPVSDDPMKPDVARTGDYYWAGGLIKRPMQFLVAYAFPTRARFIKGVDKSPSCRSENVDMKGRGKNDKSKSIYGDSCSACPFGQQPFTNGKITECNDSMNIIMLPEDLSTIFTMSFKSSSAQVGRRLIDMVRSTTQPWSRFYALDSETKKRDAGGVYAVPTVTPVADKAVPAHLAKFAADVVCPQMNDLRQEAKTLTLKRNADVATVLGTIDAEGGSVRDTM
jgi:hypothetical protein